MSICIYLIQWKIQKFKKVLVGLEHLARHPITTFWRKSFARYVENVRNVLKKVMQMFLSWIKLLMFLCENAENAYVVKFTKWNDSEASST